MCVFFLFVFDNSRSAKLNQINRKKPRKHTVTGVTEPMVDRRASDIMKFSLIAIENDIKRVYYNDVIINNAVTSIHVRMKWR